MAHSYGAPVIGWMESIKNFNREDCEEYFRTYYAPNNAVVAIVGDFNTDYALELVKQYLGGLKSGPPPPEVPRYEPEQRAASACSLSAKLSTSISCAGITWATKTARTCTLSKSSNSC